MAETESIRVLRLELAEIHVTEEPWPVHGFVVLHPQLGAVLVDSGCGGPDALLRDFRVVNRNIADALGTHGLHPSDVRVVVNTHLHFDHCGQNPSFPHARTIVQRAERERVRREDSDIDEWLTSAGVRFDLVDGEVELGEGLRLLPTPGHTIGHQAVLVRSAEGDEIFVGDAVFRRRMWDAPPEGELPRLQADDPAEWRRSLDALRSLRPARVHFCHDI